MNKISKNQAIEKGLRTYFTGEPCEKLGHICEIMVIGDRCLYCHEDEMSYRKWVNQKKGISDHKTRLARIVDNRSVIEAAREMHNKTRAEKKPAIALRSLLSRVAYGNHRTRLKNAEERIGYTHEDLRKHLSSQFKKGMSWENWGEWHIDHKKPVSLFLKEGIFDPKIIHALDNLQPLWASENIRKSNKYE